MTGTRRRENAVAMRFAICFGLVGVWGMYEGAMWIAAWAGW